MSRPGPFVHRAVRPVVVLTYASLILVPYAAGTVRAQSPQSYIQQENAKPGTTDWKLTSPGWTSGVIEGYADVTSVNRGGQIRFFVNTSDPTFTIEIFRIGYYQGLGGRRMTNPVTLAGIQQAIPSPDPTTGLIECNWINPYILTIPNSADPTDWMSGYYYVKLTSSSGKQWYVTFVVRDDARASDLIMAQAVTTAEAYNVWGGKSLYGTLANRSDTLNASRKTSFLRPYYGDETWGAGQFSNRNDFRFWEWGMVQFLEQNGYDVTYATSIDVDRDPNLLLTHRAFLSVGHDEYWSWRMRDNVEHARDAGISLGFFSANVSYWQVRFESSPTTGQPYGVMVGYKDYCGQDPITPTYLRTCRFRDRLVNRPEDQMLGVMYVTQSRQPFVVEDASHWLFTGTGLHNGDTLVNPDGSNFVGYEVDAVGPDSPPNLERAAHSPANARHANFADMTVYRAASGATVFASGSILWTYTVPQIVQVTKNALARLINNAFVDTPPLRPALPAPFQTTDIGDVGRAGFVALADTDSFTLDGAGQDAFTGSDALFYAYQGLTSDGSITARITAVQNYWDNRAGVMIRESLAPTARYVSLVSRPSESRMNGTSGVNEGVEMKSKTVAGAAPAIVAQQDLPLPNWVRLTRTGNVFDAYVSSDGATWTHLGATTLAMSGTVLVGASVASARHAVWTTASFDNVVVNGGSGGPAPPPPAPMPAPSPSPLPIPAPSSSCATPDPFLAMGGGTCYNGGWLPPGMPIPGATPAPPSPTPVPPSSSAPPPPGAVGCATPDPFIAMGGGTCYNGGWLPPGMPIPGAAPAPPSPAPLPGSSPAPTPAVSPSTVGCATPDPFTAMGGGTCYNGGWLPPGMRIPGAAPAPASSSPPPPSSSASTPTVAPSPVGCATPDPFTAMGGGTCYNGGWLPPGMTPPSGPGPSAPSTASAPSSLLVAQPATSSGCLTPNPFATMPGLIGACYNGGWYPAQPQTGTVRLINGTWMIAGDDGTTYRPTVALSGSLQQNGLAVVFAGVPLGLQNGAMVISLATIVPR